MLSIFNLFPALTCIPTSLRGYLSAESIQCGATTLQHAKKKKRKEKKALRISKTSNDENTQGDHEGAASANSGGVVAHVNPLLYTPSQRSLHQGSWTFCTDKLTSKKRDKMVLIHCFQKINQRNGRQSSLHKTNGSIKYSGGCSLDTENAAKCRLPGHEIKDHNDFFKKKV